MNTLFKILKCIVAIPVATILMVALAFFILSSVAYVLTIISVICAGLFFIVLSGVLIWMSYSIFAYLTDM